MFWEWLKAFSTNILFLVLLTSNQNAKKEKKNLPFEQFLRQPVLVVFQALPCILSTVNLEQQVKTHTYRRPFKHSYSILQIRLSEGRELKSLIQNSNVCLCYTCIHKYMCMCAINVLTTNGLFHENLSCSITKPYSFKIWHLYIHIYVSLWKISINIYRNWRSFITGMIYV